MTNSPMLRCERLSKLFGGVCALDDLTVEFHARGIVAIIGPNGAGKTTLVNVLTGFLRPDSGLARFGQRILNNLPPHRIARLGIARTFQDLRLIQWVSVLENVMLARPSQRGETLLRSLSRFGVSREERANSDAAMRLLSFVGLVDKADEFAGRLSYGQQKLLTLACCLATEATIVLLDEPIAGVHPEMAGQILDRMSQLRDQGREIVFIEHDIGAVRRVADHVIVMDEGKIIAEGPPSDVLGRPEIMEAYLG